MLSHRDTEDTESQLNGLSESVIGAAIEVHRHLGAGLLESAYESALAYELDARKLNFLRQVEYPLRYKGLELENSYRIDFLVEKQLVVEVKSVERLSDLHVAQTLTYLRLSGAKIGLLLNFNVAKLVSGIKRLRL
jgi:GxxExxY protein